VDITVVHTSENRSLFRVHQAHRLSLARGVSVEVTLSGVRGPIDWDSGNDEVLDITDDSGVKGTVKAASVGKSTITFRQNGRPLGDLHIEVYKDDSDEAVRFESTVGPEI
jgi:hypothetical protein